MSKRMLAAVSGLIFIGLVGLILWIRHGEFWQIDGCLDSGGAWDYDAKTCRFS